MSFKKSVEDFCKQIGQVFQNRVDVLINNAGIFEERVSSMEEKTPAGKDLVDMWEEVVMVNLMRMSGRYLPSKHGSVSTVSSVAATGSLHLTSEIV
jgi:NAD(P)-dependent dehydrogenase (short-subunit alcohol dehydrogenase family)